MARASGARAKMLLIDEVTYGTPPGSGYVEVPFITSNLSAEQPLQDSDVMGIGRDAGEPLKDALTADGDVRVPLDVRAIGHWLKGAFGAPVTSGSGPYAHSFRSGGWTLPSLSIEVGMPEVPHFAMYSGVKVDEISLDMARTGLASMTAKLIAQSERLGTATEDASPTVPELLRFTNWQGSVRRNGTEIGNVISASFRYANQLDRIEGLTGDGLIEGLDPSRAMAEGNLVMRFADTTLLQLAIDGTACELDFRFDLSPHVLSFKAHAVYLPRPRIEIPGPKGVQVAFAWKAAKDGSVGRMVTATLTNDVASY
jgi:hypothetical protein